MKLLSADFFNRDPRRVARALLGKLLIRKTRGGILAGRIVETEAYLGKGDEAAHATADKTARNFVLFGPPGFAYVYFIYGNYYCLNVSCLPDGVPGCVLFRALEPVAGIEQMARARGIKLSEIDFRAPVLRDPEPLLPIDRKKLAGLRKISSGPGRMCEAFGITRARDNGKDLTSRRSDLWFADDGYRPARIAATPRIGIRKAVDQPLRFVIAGNPFVSGKRVE